MRYPNVRFFCLPLACLAMWISCLGSLSALEYRIFADVSDPDLKTLAFGVQDLERALKGAGHSVDVVGLNRLPSSPSTSFVFAYARDEAVGDKLRSAGGAVPGSLKEEGFSLRVTRSGDRRVFWSFGDRVGLMYAAFELAELVRNGDLGSLADGDHNPFLSKRGLKMNIPLDARTPSYADACTSAQNNIEEIWSMDFWTSQLDRMAKNRYNTYTLWNLHPFPSLVQLADYPEVAKHDVMKANINWDQKNDKYDLLGINMVDDNILNNLSVVKEMTIDEKIQFWRDVMQYGHDRGIEFHFYTWNVFTWGAEGLHGISKDDYDRAITIDYFYQSVKAMLKTYPLLAGLGVTAGEGFPKGASDEDEEDWLWETYGRAVRDYINENDNGREVEFVHRIWWTDSSVINDRFAPLINEPRVKFNFSTKYAFARLYSHSDREMHRKNGFGREVRRLPPGGSFWLNLRNDDIFNFRWGDYGYVQEFLKNTQPNDASWDPEDVRGFHMGSDGYVWGRESTDRDPESPRQLEHDKHWLKFMLWGRLGFDPDVDQRRFALAAQRRLGVSNAELLMEAWQSASRIAPAVNRYHWHDWDYQWAVEYNHSRRPNWHSLDEWAKESGNDWSAVAAEIEAHADVVLGALPALQSTAGNKEYIKTIKDLECWAYLGKFYAERIRAAHYLDGGDELRAAGHATESARQWLKYATLASMQYSYQLLGRLELETWLDLYQFVLDDIPGSHQLNQLPQVSISSPSSGAELFPAPRTVTVAVDASDPDGSIARVELWRDGLLVATDSSHPYVFELEGMDVGSYLIEVRAYDNEGDFNQTSLSFRVGETPSENLGQLPWFEDFSLPDGLASDVGVTAWSASRVQGSFQIENGRFMINEGGSVGELRTGWIDTGSVASVDVSVDVDFSGGLEDNQDFVQLVAVIDGDREVVLDELWGQPQKATMIGTVAAGSLLRVAIRMYVSSEVEYYYVDNLKITKSSSSVNQPPEVEFILPQEGQIFEDTDDIAVEVAANDRDGAIGRVELWINGALFKARRSPPFEWLLEELSPGDYSLTATAYDDAGASSSANSSLRVNESQGVRMIQLRLDWSAVIADWPVEVVSDDGSRMFVTDENGRVLIDGLSSSSDAFIDYLTNGGG